MEDYYEEFWGRQKKVLFSAYINLFIIAVNILVFVYGTFFPEVLYENYIDNAMNVVYGGEYYRLLTSMFVHFDIEHIFSNMIVLLFIGANVEYDIGHAEYFILYMASGLIGNIASNMYTINGMEDVVSFGASGGVFGVMGAVAVIAFFGRKRIRAGRNFIIRLAIMLFISIYNGFVDPQIDNAAHIGGFISGIVLTVFITLIFMKQYTMEEWL